MRTLSFRVLAHAEIETYFEDRADERARSLRRIGELVRAHRA